MPGPYKILSPVFVGGSPATLGTSASGELDCPPLSNIFPPAWLSPPSLRCGEPAHRLDDHGERLNPHTY